MCPNCIYCAGSMQLTKCIVDKIVLFNMHDIALVHMATGALYLHTVHEYAFTDEVHHNKNMCQYYFVLWQMKDDLWDL